MKMWISRDSNGDLHLHSTKPEKQAYIWILVFTDGKDYHQVEIKLIEND